MKSLTIIFLFILGMGTLSAQQQDSLYVYPNPFNLVANIHFELTQDDTVSLAIYNQWGTVFRTFYEDELLTKGSYDAHWLATGVPDGLYMVILKINSQTPIGKKVIKYSSTTDIPLIDDNKYQPIFPNPTGSDITIPIKGQKIVTITDLSGKVIKVEKTEKEIISMSNLSDGEYWITVTQDGRTFSQLITLKKN